MNASKENAQTALKCLNDEQGSNIIRDHPSFENFNFIRLFLEAAKKKLPTEAAFARDKRRTVKG